MIVVVILPTVNMKSITFNRFVHVHSLALRQDDFSFILILTIQCCNNFSYTF